MIGNLIRYDPTLKQLSLYEIHPFDDLTDFFNLLYAATVIFDFEHDSFTDDICSESPIVTFNAYITPESYYERLSNLFIIAQKEIDNVLRSHELKHDKLKYLLSLIKKLEEYINYLIKDANGQFSHLLFSFTNKCAEEPSNGITFSQSDFQQYFLWMNFFLNKSHSYLNSLYDITEKTNQSDFPTNRKAPDNNASIVNDPFNYLNYLFARNGIKALHKAFLPTEDEMALFNAVYDKDTETKSGYEYNEETERHEPYVSKFSDVLLKILTNEYYKSMRLVREKLSEVQDEPIIKLYLKKNLQLLKYLLKKVEENGYKDKYPLTELLLLVIITWLFEEYEVFCPPELENFKQSTNKRRLELISSINSPPSAPKALPASNNFVQGFVWLINDQILCRSFYMQLTSGPEPFIDPNTNIDSIYKLFSIPGTSVSAPKIKWKLMHKDKPNKTILLYLFRQLMSNDLINYVLDRELIKKINEFFCWGENQNEFPNLGVSLSSAKGHIAETPAKKRIDQIIEKLNNVMLSA